MITLITGPVASGKSTIAAALRDTASFSTEVIELFTSKNLDAFIANKLSGKGDKFDLILVDNKLTKEEVDKFIAKSRYVIRLISLYRNK